MSVRHGTPDAPKPLISVDDYGLDVPQMKPALTREEWGELGYPHFSSRSPKRRKEEPAFGYNAHVADDAPYELILAFDQKFRGYSTDGDSDDCVRGFEGEDRHKLAALALHQQPWGFLQADVVLLKSLRSDIPSGRQRAIDHLIDRIQSLLPPETEIE